MIMKRVRQLLSKLIEYWFVWRGIVLKTFPKWTRKSFFIILPDALSRTVYIHREYEPWVFDFFKKILSEGDTAIDIGRHIGIYASFMAELVGKGKVYAFEPIEEKFHVLSKNAKKFGFIAINAAVGKDGLSFQSFNHYGLFYGRWIPLGVTSGLQTWV